MVKVNLQEDAYVNALIFIFKISPLPYAPSG